MPCAIAARVSGNADALPEMATEPLGGLVAPLVGACLLGFAMASLTSAAFAQEPRDASGLSLEELMRGMATTSGVIARFREEKQIALLEEPIQSSGTFYFVPPDRFVRFTSQPESSALIIDGKKLRFRQGDREEFDLSGNPMARIFIDNFIVLFNGDLAKLEKLYHTDFSAERESWTLNLEPRGSPLRGHVREIALRGDRSGIREIVMQNRDGERTATALEVIDPDFEFTDDQLEDLFVEGVVPVTVSIQ